MLAKETPCADHNREDGYRLFFYSNEGIEPKHVHVEYQNGAAKFWIKPLRLASNHGLNGSQLSKAALLIAKYEDKISEKWDEYFSKKV